MRTQEPFDEWYVDLVQTEMSRGVDCEGKEARGIETNEEGSRDPTQSLSQAEFSRKDILPSHQALSTAHIC